MERRDLTQRRHGFDQRRNLIRCFEPGWIRLRSEAAARRSAGTRRLEAGGADEEKRNRRDRIRVQMAKVMAFAAGRLMRRLDGGRESPLGQFASHNRTPRLPRHCRGKISKIASVQIQFSMPPPTAVRKARSSCEIVLRRVRYLYHFNPYFPLRYATNSSRKQTHHDLSHKRMSYELTVNWNRRLTRTPPFTCTFARHSWTASAFRDRGRREQKLKKHKRHELAMAL